MLKKICIGLLLITLLSQSVNAQTPADSTLINKEYVNITEALKNPEYVYRLNLSNQNIQFADSVWPKFTNLQYLSLKNDHLKKIPEGIGYLKSLRVLDLSGNDFKVLPETFSGLSNLQELFLNDDKYFQFANNIPILSKLPNLKSLHLENDGIKKLPESINKLNNLESLYLNNNHLKKIPSEIKGLRNLKYLDIHDNDFRIQNQFKQEQGFGIKIRF